MAVTEPKPFNPPELGNRTVEISRDVLIELEQVARWVVAVASALGPVLHHTEGPGRDFDITLRRARGALDALRPTEAVVRDILARVSITERKALLAHMRDDSLRALQTSAALEI